jgi:hypothetical protein
VAVRVLVEEIARVDEALAKPDRGIEWAEGVFDEGELRTAGAAARLGDRSWSVEIRPFAARVAVHV